MTAPRNDEGHRCNGGLPKTQTQLDTAILPPARPPGKPSASAIEYVQAPALFVVPMCRNRREIYIRMRGVTKTVAVQIASVASVGADEARRGGQR